MRNHIRSRAVALFAVAVVGLGALPFLAGAQTAEPQGWLHVQVQGDGADGEQVAVNLPLGAVGAVMAMAPEGIISSDGRLHVAEEHGVSVSDIRRAWQEILAVGDSEFVTVQNDEQTVRVARTGDQIQVRVTGDDENVRVDLPVLVVDALLSGEGETLNINAALDRLRELRGDIVRVVEDERQIRVWVDDQAEQ